MFGSFELLAGSFDIKRGAQFINGKFLFPLVGSVRGEAIPPNSIESLSVATEESVKKMAGAIGWGLVGGLATGGIGLIAGVLAGGNKKNIVFVCQLKDGRKFMGKTDGTHYQKMTSAFFDADKLSYIKPIPEVDTKTEESKSLVFMAEKARNADSMKRINTFCRKWILPPLLGLFVLLGLTIWAVHDDKANPKMNAESVIKKDGTNMPRKASLLRQIVNDY